MLKGLVKDSVAYGIANTIQKLVPLFVVPVVIHRLGQTSLKLYDVSFVYAYLFSWLFILGQDAAASVFYFDEVKTSFNKKQVLRYGFLIQTCFFAVIALFFLPLKNWVAHLLFPTDAAIGYYWIKALLIIPAHMALNYVLNILLWQRRKREYIALCVCQTAFSLLSVYVFVVLFHGDLSSLFYCLIGSTALCAAIGLSLVSSSLFFAGLPVNKPLIKKLVLFGIPFALTAFFNQALPSVDRYFLLRFGQDQALPQYILAVKLGGLVSMGIGAFALAFTPYSMSRINQPKAEKEISSLFEMVAVVGFMAMPVLLLFKDLLVRLFADTSYALSARLLPFFFFGWLFDLFSYFSMLGMYKAQNSLIVLTLFATGIVLISGLNVLLIPGFGLYGAAIAFCATKIVMFFIPLVYLRKHFTLTVHTKSFLASGVAAVVCSYLLYRMEWYSYSLLLAPILCLTAFYLYKQYCTQILLS